MPIGRVSIRLEAIAIRLDAIESLLLGFSTQCRASDYFLPAFSTEVASRNSKIVLSVGSWENSGVGYKVGRILFLLVACDSNSLPVMPPWRFIQ